MPAAASLDLLDNIVWHSLSGPQRRFAAGSETARRYARGLSPLTGFADPARPDFDALAAHADIGEHLFCGAWTGAPPAGWRVDAEVPAVQMVWNGGVPEDDAAPHAIALTDAHVDAMLELVALTQPGPFGPRTIELGDYFGVFEDGKLVAMAGERMEAGCLREISGVCTRPEAQGRGLARGLMHRLIRLQIGRGLVPFLHVMSFNTRALELYERMGFGRHRELLMRIVCRE
ncbi:MAG TPA: GNAT family N-acetyltransferase [Candidatus Limnocylindrales bacterium]|nr:GNAT family N-acetyltransferase [Candidatus Limnocylindrales bacterium]